MKRVSFIALALLLLAALSCKKDIKPLTVTDFDGNVYKTVKIGNQIWMAENLKTTHYRKGEAIENVTDNQQWASKVTGAYCDNLNIVDFGKTYGHLYNWYAVNDQRNLAPVGWHVATDEEWLLLANSVGGVDVAGAKLREAGTAHWVTTSEDIKNEFEFTALPAGLNTGISPAFFGGLHQLALFWTSNMFDADKAKIAGINYTEKTLFFENQSKKLGLSVRCVKD
ncbi:MAG: fibrobacter succinogenes major paralogous domain-containing protein [Sphingobacteriaceae bacterium]